MLLSGIFLVLLSTVARIVAVPDGIYTIELLKENAGRAKYLGFDDETGSSPDIARDLPRLPLTPSFVRQVTSCCDASPISGRLSTQTPHPSRMSSARTARRRAATSCRTRPTAAPGP